MSYRDEEIGKSLLSALITVDGLILAIGWNVFDWSKKAELASVLWLIKAGSICLSISLLFGILCFQFMVTSVHNDESSSAMTNTTVSYIFLVSWLSFLVGIILFVAIVWNI